MLPLEIRKYVYDIQQARELLSEFTAGKTLDDYTFNAMLRSAVERQFEIIGEALNQMLRRDPALPLESVTINGSLRFAIG